MAVLQARYEELDDVAQRFDRLAVSNEQMRERVNAAVEALADGGWRGSAAQQFLAEMADVVFPALKRLTDAMIAATSTTLAVKQGLQQSEADAANLFRGGATWDYGDGDGLFAGAFDDAGNLIGPSADQPIAPWLTSLFVGGAFSLGTRVPIFGRGGIVPGGYTGAGKRLWLYIGGSGTDTTFSIHPRAGLFGRAPRNLPKPSLRFDYGPIPKGFTTSGQLVNVPSGENFFHWNVDGAQGKSGTMPLFSAFGNEITHDHQLLTNNGLPKGNVAGRFGGATVIKGVSRGLFVVGAGLDAYSIATAENKPREITRVAGGWAGAWAGAEGGALAGAAIGSIFPGPGTAIGGFVGGVAGGVGGYIGGSNIAQKVFDWF
ncbi:MAG TPA: WXG100 family type VII secretion target [Chloroflexota bacterium]